MTRILLVEDDAAVRRGVIDNLTCQSYQVFTLPMLDRVIG